MGYRQLATGPVLLWAIVALLARVPIAAASLAMVFLTRDLPGGYAFGGTLAAVYVIGEVAGSAVLGTMLRPHTMRLQLAAGMAAGALAFGALAARPSAALLVPLAFLAGAAPAANPGGMRSMLAAAAGDKHVSSAFSADAILTEIVWMSAPALVTILALQVSPSAPLAVAAVCMGLAAAGVLFLRLTPADEETAPAAPIGRREKAVRLFSGWPVYLTSAATMSLLAVSELVLPALLEFRDIPVGYAGVLLSGLAALSAVGAFVYGLRRWPGTPRMQSLILLSVTTAAITLVALAPPLPLIAAGFAVAGLTQSVVLVTRSLSLREQLPEPLHAAGYSLMYAVQGVGYSISAVVAAFVLSRGNPVLAILAGVALTVVLIVLSTVRETRRVAVLVGEKR
ncbi:hypothetical protein [Catenuloplanes atrovinosus]|uniref:MFS family permease n=1 Tax=Catenuloplanes atrovinosus TaxID=137266 RepID=A0AAE3YIN3_9ACTN|nr:hypothetical protein [Catenuloplanes atrovinosus]MDR7273622.1 MFS family permease [Catenuloplanes atrovinosus]